MADGGHVCIARPSFQRCGRQTAGVDAGLKGDVMAILGPLMATTGTDKASRDTGAFLAYLGTRRMSRAARSAPSASAWEAVSRLPTTTAATLPRPRAWNKRWPRRVWTRPRRTAALRQLDGAGLSVYDRKRPSSAAKAMLALFDANAARLNIAAVLASVQALQRLSPCPVRIQRRCHGARIAASAWPKLVKSARSSSYSWIERGS